MSVPATSKCLGCKKARFRRMLSQVVYQKVMSVWTLKKPANLPCPLRQIMKEWIDHQEQHFRKIHRLIKSRFNYFRWTGHRQIDAQDCFLGDFVVYLGEMQDGLFADCDAEWNIRDILLVFVSNAPYTMLKEMPEKQRNMLQAIARSGHCLIYVLFALCKISLICLEGISMTPHQGNTILFRSSQQLPRLRLGPSKGFLS